MGFIALDQQLGASPCEILASLRPLLPRLGITRVANVTGLDRVGIPVAAAVRPQSRSLVVAQGKGVSLVDAKVSAIMEAVETFHGECITRTVLHGARATVAENHRCVDTALLSWSVLGGYQPERPMLWVEAMDLADGGEIWVPLQCVHTAYTPEMVSPFGLHACTTGLSAGSSYHHAIEHGIHEVIERDATVLHKLLDSAEQDCRRLDAGSVTSAVPLDLLAQLARAGLSVALWDITSDIGVATFACFIGDLGTIANSPLLAGGYGCHFDRAIALTKAILEAAQSRLTAIAGARDDLSGEAYASRAERDELFQQYFAQAAYRDFADVPDHAAIPDVAAGVPLLRERLAEAGFEQVIVVDLAKRDIGIPVVRVIVPGLEIALEPEESVTGPGMNRRQASA